MQNFKDYYKILGISKQATADDIKKAYRRLARKYHPDINPSPESEDLFKDVNEAYEVLSDTAKRRQYDQFGQYYQQTGFRPGGGSPFSSPFSSEDFGFSGFNSNNVDLSQFDDFQDFIDQLLGRVGGSSSQSTKAPRSSGFTQEREANYDAEASIQLSMSEAYEGGKRRLRVEGGRILEVNIPAGVTPGKRIRLRGQGHSHPSGSTGDLYLKIEFKEHPFYRLEGSDLYCDLPVTPSEAILGTQVEVPTLSGSVKLRVPPGVITGQKLRLSQRGFPKGGGTFGDLFLQIKLVLPEKISPRERELYEELQQIQSDDPRIHWKAKVS